MTSNHKIKAFVLAMSLALGCKSQPQATGLLCHSCSDDSQCGGNPCFQDSTGARFCGAPCGSCPSGFSCHPIQGTGSVVNSCFPNDNICVSTGPSGDMSPTPGADMSSNDMSSKVDMTKSTPPDLMTVPCTAPASTGVTNSGGTVDRLYFGFTGDTRPCGSADTACQTGDATSSGYPQSLQTIINNIFTQMGQKGVQFAIDQGDHMEATSNATATMQMGDYLNAAALMAKPIFMTLGNHECSNSYNMGSDCSTTCATDYKCSAFLAALQPVSPSNPYYSFNIHTSAGLATFIVVSDDTWNSTQEAWLTQQLTTADTAAKYTFVSRHHPEGNTEQTFFPTIENLIRAHKYTLFLTGHSHLWKREPGDPRAIVMGQGGAPFDDSDQMYWGYGTVMQCPDNSINVTVFDQATGNPMDSFSVPPQ
jgi:Calcineurin-like phosphoesterase